MPTSIRFNVRILPLLITLVVVCFGFIGMAIHSAQSEHRAIQELVARGATYDDWVGWREIFGSDYRPIVQVDLPANVELEQAMNHLVHLDNLDYLGLGEETTDEDLRRLSELYWLSSLNLTRTSIGDGAVEYLKRCKNLKWLCLAEEQLSEQAIVDLQNQLSNCTIEVR